MKRYGEYKDSGVEWLGEIPKHWEKIKLKYCCLFQEGPGILTKDFKEAGVPLIRISGLTNGKVTKNGCNYLDPEKVEQTWKHFTVIPSHLLSCRF